MPPRARAEQPDDPRGACDLSGEHPVNAPLTRRPTSACRTRSPPVGATCSVRGDWSTTSEYNTTFSADPRLTQPAYDWINVRVGARWDRFEIVAWVENLTDETVASIEGVLNVYAGDRQLPELPAAAALAGSDVPREPSVSLARRKMAGTAQRVRERPRFNLLAG